MATASACLIMPVGLPWVKVIVLEFLFFTSLHEVLSLVWREPFNVPGPPVFWIYTWFNEVLSHRGTQMKQRAVFVVVCLFSDNIFLWKNLNCMLDLHFYYLSGFCYLMIIPVAFGPEVQKSRLNKKKQHTNQTTEISQKRRDEKLCLWLVVSLSLK